MAKILLNTPKRFQLMNRWWIGLTWPYSSGASRHRTPLPITKRMPLVIRRSPARGPRTTKGNISHSGASARRGLVVGVIGGDRERAGAGDHVALVGQQRQRRRQRNSRNDDAVLGRHRSNVWATRQLRLRPQRRRARCPPHQTLELGSRCNPRFFEPRRYHPRSGRRYGTTLIAAERTGATRG